MTDKQIIDGVDVSGCAYITYRDSENPICSETGQYCKGYDICYFKQLKRKEQECEELKKELQAQRDFTAHEQKLIYCVAYDETCKTGNDCKQEKCIFKDNIKLKQTLAEIKEIAEGMHDLWINKTQYTDMNNLVEHLLECELNRIRYKLDEISECETNNDR